MVSQFTYIFFLLFWSIGQWACRRHVLTCWRRHFPRTLFLLPDTNIPRAHTGMFAFHTYPDAHAAFYNAGDSHSLMCLSLWLGFVSQGVMTWELQCDVMTCESQCDVMTCESQCDVMTYESQCDVMTCESQRDVMTCESQYDVMTYESRCDAETVDWRNELL